MLLDINVYEWPDEWVEKVLSYWSVRLWGTCYHRYYALLDLFRTSWRSLQIKSYYVWTQFARARPLSALKKLLKGLASKDRAITNLRNVLREPSELATPRSREFYRCLLAWFGHDYILWGAGTIVAAMLTCDTRWMLDAELWTSLFGNRWEGPHEDLCPEDTFLIARQCILVAFARWGPWLLHACSRGVYPQEVADALARDVARCLESCRCRVPYIRIEARYPVRVVVRV